MPFARRHVFRGEVATPEMMAMQVAMNAGVYEHMWGPSEHLATGYLKDFDLTDRLHEIDVPVLVTSGAHEMVAPADVEDMLARVPDVQSELFEDAAHLSEFEAPARYTNVLRDFLMKVDGR